MWPQLKPRHLDDLHRHVVAEVLKRVLHLETVNGMEPEQAVDEWFAQFPEGARELLAHDDPVLVALEVSGVTDRRALLKRQRELEEVGSDVVAEAQSDWFLDRRKVR